jgi:hypothetical protein
MRGDSAENSMELASGKWRRNLPMKTENRKEKMKMKKEE